MNFSNSRGNVGRLCLFIYKDIFRKNLQIFYILFEHTLKIYVITYKIQGL